MEPEVLLAVSKAVWDREVLRFDYASRSGDEIGDRARRAEAHHVAVAEGRWYLVASRDDDHWRTFRLDRLTPRIPTGPRFGPRELPGGDVVAYVAARIKASTQDDVFPCRGHAVIVRPSPDFLPFAGDGVVEEGSWSWTALAASLGRFDAERSEVGPPELREVFGALAARFERAADLR